MISMMWVCFQQFQGGPFSISNLGMFPVDHFCAIVNPPQAAIMAVGRGVKKVTLLDGQPATTMSMVVTVSADNRVFVGDVGAKFLNSFKAKSRHRSYRRLAVNKRCPPIDVIRCGSLTILSSAISHLYSLPFEIASSLTDA